MKKIFLTAMAMMLPWLAALNPSAARSATAAEDPSQDMPMEDAPHVSSSGKGESPAYGDRILFGSIGEASNLIPYLTSDSASHEVADMLYVAPLRYNKDLQPEPWAAESWSMEEGGRLMRFTLRKGILWEDGQELTAEDVAFSLNRATATAQSEAYTESFKEAVVVDDYTVRLDLLYPDVAVVTSADADHLDIYGTHEAVKEAFAQFVRQIRPGGFLVIKQGVDIVVDNPQITVYRYSYDVPCDFYARNVQLLEGGHYRYDIVVPGGVVEGCTLGIPGWVNIENSVAAVASVWCAARAEGVALDADALRGALASFSGVKRRFEFYVNTPRQVYMDDYAHHPRELAATLTSVQKMFPGRRITALFQPHLYTRTRDLYEEFAESLSHADEVVLLPIYPAREEPIPGVTSELIARHVAVPCRIVGREALADTVAAMDTDVVVSFGAGNIDACCEALAEKLGEKS